MWPEKQKNGKVKFVEWFINPINGKRSRACVTFDKNTASTRKIAQSELARIISNKISACECNSNTVTFFDVCELYLENKKGVCKKSTYLTYTSHINSIKKAIGDVYISKLTVVYVDKKAKKLDRWTQIALKSLFIWMYKKDYISNDLGRKMSIKSPSDKDEKLYYEKDEVKEILEKLDSGNTYIEKTVRLLIEFLVLTGMRIGEVLALNESDFNDSIISITKRYYRGDIDRPKSKAGIRDIAINARAKQIISEMKLLKRMYGIESSLIFPSAYRLQNNYLEQGTIRDVLNRKGVNTKIHIYRHTHASILAEQGISLEAIQRRLGHEKSATTRKIYIHVTNKIKTKDKELFKELEIL